MRKLAKLLLSGTILMGFSAVAMSQPDSPSLAEVVAHEPFASAYKHMLSTAQPLPSWVRNAAGPGTPAEQVQVAGKPSMLFWGCKAHDCSSEWIFVLYDPNAHSASGVFVENISGARGLERSSLRWLGDLNASKRDVLMKAISVQLDQGG